MRVMQDFLYIILRNGKRFRHFAAKQTAMSYIAACWDLDPASTWMLVTEEVTKK